MGPIAAFAAFSPTSPLGPYQLVRREPGPTDVAIEILYCGVCHSDLHTVRGEWDPATYPCVPGHEIVGRVTAVGASVTAFHVGDIAGVGCMVDSCRHCHACRDGLEQYCENETIWTYDARDRHTGGVTYGGYSTAIVVDEAFVLRIAAALDLARTAPLLCAGITTYSPLRHWGAGAGTRVGVVGLGGLGHMGVKIAHAMQAHVTLFTSSPAKADDARRLGADDVVVTGQAGRGPRIAPLDLIIDTVGAPHDLTRYLVTLRRDGALVLVGLPPTPHPFPPVGRLTSKRRSIAGSAIGGVAETQEMLDFCAEHRIGSDIELIAIQDIDTAYERLLRGEVKYRFVIDIASLRS